MPTLKYEGTSYVLEEGETVLGALRRNGVEVASSCESGVCQTCLMKAVSGDIPDAAQKGLRDTFKDQNYFLSCVCRPESDLGVAPADAETRVSTKIEGVEALDGNVLRLVLRPETPLHYRAGQFVNFLRPNGLVRSYSIASVPELEDTLEFHVAVLPEGRMSGWIGNDAQPGDTLEIAGPLGTCFYTFSDPDQPLFLLGTGTGLAPLYGIARDALAAGHQGGIHLFHGALREEGLYLDSDLRALAEEHPNFRYYPCALEGPATRDTVVGPVDELAMTTIPELKGWRVFLCGAPDMVKLMQRKSFLAGASMKDIHADAFLPGAGS